MASCVRHLVARDYGGVIAVTVGDQIADLEHDGECSEAFAHWIVVHHDFSHGMVVGLTNRLFRESFSLLSMG